MGAIATAFDSAFRDYNTAGVPSSGPRKPVKSEIRALGPVIEAALVAGARVYDTITILRAVDAAALIADTQVAIVAGRATPGDCAPFIVQWDAASTATADNVLVFRPTAGAAVSGAGRWLRKASTPSQTFTSGDATPSVANGEWFVTAGTTTITDFDDAFEGQMFSIERGGADIVIAHDAAKIDLGGSNITLTAASPRLSFRHVGGVNRLIGSAGAGAYLPSGAGSVSTTVTSILDALNFAPERFGAIGDGTTHPVSEWLTGGARDRGFANLAAITAVYPHVTASTDEIDWAAIRQCLVVTGRCLLGAKNYYTGGNPLIVGGSQHLEGIDPGNEINGTEGSRITCALATTPAVQINGGAGSLPASIKKLHVRRATGTIPSGSVGVSITSADYVLVEDVYASHHAVGISAGGQLDIMLHRCVVADVSESYFDASCPGVSLVECYAGRNGLTTGAGTGAHYLRIFDGADTLYVERCVFSDASTGDAADCILFSGYDDPNGIFAFTDCHWEGFSDFIVTVSTPLAQRISFKGCTATCNGQTPRLIVGVDSVVNDIQRLRMHGCLFDGAGWVFNFAGVTGEINGNYFSEPVTLNGGAVAFSGNTVNGAITLSGSHSGTALSGNVATAIVESSATGAFSYEGRRPAFRAHKNGTNQSGVVNGTLTKITFSTEAFDIGGHFDTTNSRWTPPAGVVMLHAQMQITGYTADADCSISIHKNGSATPIANFGFAPNIDVEAIAQVFAVDFADGDDFYEVQVYLTTASTGTVSGGATRTWFNGVRLG